MTNVKTFNLVKYVLQNTSDFNKAYILCYLIDYYSFAELGKKISNFEYFTFKKGSLYPIFAGYFSEVAKSKLAVDIDVMFTEHEKEIINSVVAEFASIDSSLLLNKFDLLSSDESFEKIF